MTKPRQCPAHPEGCGVWICPDLVAALAAKPKPKRHRPMSAKVRQRLEDAAFERFASHLGNGGAIPASRRGARIRGK